MLHVVKGRTLRFEAIQRHLNLPKARPYLAQLTSCSHLLCPGLSNTSGAMWLGVPADAHRPGSPHTHTHTHTTYKANAYRYCLLQAFLSRLFLRESVECARCDAQRRARLRSDKSRRQAVEIQDDTKPRKHEDIGSGISSFIKLHSTTF